MGDYQSIADKHETADREPTSAAHTLLQNIGSFSEIIASQRKRKRDAPSELANRPRLDAAKLSLGDLGYPEIRTSTKQQPGPVSKNLDTDAGIGKKLEAPVPSALRNKLNRQDAYGTAKDTLDRWLDTVKSGREAEYLKFPLQGKSKTTGGPREINRNPRMNTCKDDQLDFENKVASSLLGLKHQRPEGQHKKIESTSRTPDDFEPRKRIAHLRIERELLSREMIRTKRQKKIKSKSYHRSLKRKKLKIKGLEEEAETGVYGDNGLPESPEVRENTLSPHFTGIKINDWDDSRANASITNRSTATYSLAIDNVENDEGSPNQNRLRGIGTTLDTLKFMRKANDRHLERIIYDPNSGSKLLSGRRVFHDGVVQVGQQTPDIPARNSHKELLSDSNAEQLSPKAMLDRLDLGQLDHRHKPDNPWLRCELDGLHTGHLDKTFTKGDIPQNLDISLGQTASLTKPDGSQSRPKMTSYEHTGDKLNADLVIRAFSGDSILSEMQKNSNGQKSPKAQQAKKNLDGWGDWSSLKTRRSRQRDTSKNSGEEKILKPTNTQHHQIKVVVNNKRTKKIVKYMATKIPYPFETRDQYERSLRFPMGQEWSTKQTHQSLTTPHIIVEPGMAITPLSHSDN